MKVPGENTHHNDSAQINTSGPEGQEGMRTATAPPFQLVATAASPDNPEDWPPFEEPTISASQLKTAAASNRRSWKAFRSVSWNYFQGINKHAPLPKKSALHDFTYRLFYFQHIVKHCTAHLKPASNKGNSIKLDGIFLPNAFDQTLDSFADLVNAHPTLFRKHPAANFIRSMFGNIVARDKSEVKDTPALRSGNLNNYELLKDLNRFKAFEMKWGASGPEVGTLQGILKELGYFPQEFEPTNYYGKKTRSAVLKFQRITGLSGKKGIKAGVVERLTLQKLDQVWTGREQSEEIGYLGKEKYRQFRVPVFAAEGFREDTSKAYSFIFRVPLGKVKSDRFKHIFSKPLKNASKNSKSLFSDGDIARGYAEIAVTEDHFRSVTAKIESTDGLGQEAQEDHPEKGMEVELQTQEDRGFLIEKKVELESLQKKIAEAKATLARMDMVDMDLTNPQRFEQQEKKILKLENEEKELKGELEGERSRLGITEAEEMIDEARFKGQFQKLAVRVGKEMLQDNLHQVAAFQDKFREHTSFTRGLQKLLVELSHSYAKADQLRETALSNLRKSRQTGWAGKILPDSILDLIHEGPSGLLLYFIDPPNQDFREWAEQEKAIQKKLAQNVKQYPVLAHPELHLREFSGEVGKQGTGLAGSKRKAVQYDWIFGKVKGLLNGTEDNIKGVELSEENVWQFAPVIDKAMERMGIAQDSHYAILINQAREKANETPIWKTILNWGLMIASLLSGPVGWLGAVGGLAVSATDLVSDAKKTFNQRRAGKAALNKEDALIQDIPGWGWLVMDLAFLGLDIADSLKAVKEFTRIGKEGGKGARKIKKGEMTDQDAVDLGQALKNVAKKSGSNQDIHWAARFLMKQGGKFLNMLDRIKDKNIKQALAKMLKNNRVGKAVIRLFDQTKKVPGLFQRIIRHLAGAGRATAKLLPQVLDRLIGKLNPDHPLFRTILTDVAVRAHFIEHGFSETFKKWRQFTKQNARSGMQRFKDMAKDLYRKGMGKLGKDGLVRAFGKGFHEWTQQRKNLELLMRSGHNKGLDLFLGGKVKDPGLKAAWRKFLGQNHIGMTLNKEKAIARMEGAFESLLAQNMKGMDEFVRFQRAGALGKAGLSEKVFAGVRKQQYDVAVKGVKERSGILLPEGFSIPRNEETLGKLLKHLHKIEGAGKGTLRIQKGKLRYWDAFLHVMHHPGEDIATVMARIKKGERFDPWTKALSKAGRKGKDWDVIADNFRKGLTGPGDAPIREAFDWIGSAGSGIKAADRQKVLRGLFRYTSSQGQATGQVRDFLHEMGQLNRQAGGAGMPGMGKVLTSVAAGNTTTQGATLQLRLANRLRVNNKLKPDSIFEKEIAVPNTKRRREYDLVNGGVHYEVKLWTNANSPGIGSYLRKYTKKKFRQTKGKRFNMSQFEKDILIHAKDGYKNFKLVIDDSILKNSPNFKESLFKQMEDVFQNSKPLAKLLKKNGHDPSQVWTQFKTQFDGDMIAFLGEKVTGKL